MKPKHALIALVGWAALSAPVQSASPSAARQLGTSIADAVEKVMPSVVVVRTEATRYRMARDWFFGQIYGIPERLAGQGSGVIITKDGYVLTNNHVIDDAQEIEIVLDDGTKYPATLVGQDPHIDLAVVKIEKAGGRSFTAIEAGDSDLLRIGEFVIAIGSPFSLSSSVTLGIVSQKGRAIGALPYEDFIQSDAAVNVGNSGGPLVDVDGRMVGVNTLIQTAGYSQGNIGISFAIPANLAMHVAEALIRDGKWERPWIGISMNQTPDGVVVEEIVPASPAAERDLRPKDVILAVEDKTVATARDVQRAIMQRRAGEEIAVKVLRAGEKKVITIKTERMPPPLMMYRE
jgi:S1-C subfamily serine protease